MNLDELYPSRFISAASLGGQSRRVTIQTITREPVGNPPQLKPIMKFTNGKEMVCNKTNGSRLGLAFGRNTDVWPGREIELYEDHVDFAGKTVPALRVRAVNGATTPATTTPAASAASAAPATVAAAASVGDAWEGPAAAGGDIKDDIPW